MGLCGKFWSPKYGCRFRAWPWILVTALERLIITLLSIPFLCLVAIVYFIIQTAGERVPLPILRWLYQSEVAFIPEETGVLP